MDYKVMKRPMFRVGGPTSGGTGITSGLDTPKRGLVDGPGKYSQSFSISDAMSMGSSDRHLDKILNMVVPTLYLVLLIYLIYLNKELRPMIKWVVV